MTISLLVNLYSVWMKVPKHLRIDILTNILEKEEEPETLQHSYLINSIYIYENNNPENDSKTEFADTVFDSCIITKVYQDITKDIKTIITNSVKKDFNYELYTKYNKYNFRKVLHQIDNEIAYIPGNYGYERTRDHFESLLSKVRYL